MHYNKATMKKRSSGDKTIQNKRARFDYELQDSFIAGIVLSGPEVKSLRMGHGSLRGSFVNIHGNEAWLENAAVTPLSTNAKHLTSELQLRNRKLLLKKRELDQLIEAKNQGLTIVPVKLMTRSHFIKVEIAIARGKKKYDKRQAIKKRDQDRDIRRGGNL